MSGILREYSTFSQLTILVAYFADTHPNELNYITVQMKKNAQRRRKHGALAVVRRSQKISPRRRPPSRGRRTAKI